tara:strand:- start:45299 stop:45484 length:186 start_codon:yes stop_codon:yes gene_type:complete
LLSSVKPISVLRLPTSRGCRIGDAMMPRRLKVADGVEMRGSGLRTEKHLIEPAAETAKITK